MKRPLESINSDLFESVEAKEMAHMIGGAVSIVPTFIITHVNSTIDVDRDTTIDA